MLLPPYPNSCPVKTERPPLRVRGDSSPLVPSGLVATGETATAGVLALSCVLALRSECPLVFLQFAVSLLQSFIVSHSTSLVKG